MDSPIGSIRGPKQGRRREVVSVVSSGSPVEARKVVTHPMPFIWDISDDLTDPL